MSIIYNMNNSYPHYQSPNRISYNHSLRTATKKDSVYRAESHPNIEVLLLLAGQMYFFIDGATYRISSGDFIILNAWSYHWSQLDDKNPCERINLHFSPEFIPSLTDIDLMFPFSNTNLYQNIIPKKLVEKTKIPEIMRAFDPICNASDKYKDAKLISLIQDLVIEINLALEILLTKEYHLISSPQSTNELLQATIKYINSTLSQAVSTAKIAAQIGISESYLYNIFKTQMGISLHTYIQNQKMQLALSLIRKGYTPQNVSEMLGFDYYATFFNQFKAVFGKSPNQFR